VLPTQLRVENDLSSNQEDCSAPESVPFDRSSIGLKLVRKINERKIRRRSNESQASSALRRRKLSTKLCPLLG